jgi:hypothetical protein
MIMAHYANRFNEPNGNENTIACQILHLARPLLDTLAKGDDR